MTLKAQHATIAPPAPISAAPKGMLQRACACGQHTHGEGECEACRNKHEGILQRSAVGHSPDTAPPIVQEVLRSPGQPLDTQTRAFMEPRFGHNFSQVRVHTDGRADESARAVNALAYTVGQDVVFGAGQYVPETSAGWRLLAHELTHVVQQNGSNGTVQRIGAPGEHYEKQAQRVAHSLAWGVWSPHYAKVAAIVAQSSIARPLADLPLLSSTGVLLQRVQLTYDDGPDSASNTRAVLDSLNKAGARATFYLVGKRVAQGDNWRVVFDIAAAGHWLGNHAYDWNDATDNHIFLHGTAEERVQKMLQTEWAIRDALIRGRTDTQQRNAWNTIPLANRNYIEDVINHGTGRFRTPGFRSHFWSSDGNTTMAAIASANQVLAASGLRPFAITEVTSWGITREGVSVDPEDWRAGRTQAQIEANVRGDLSSNTDSILLHSRLSASAAATPAILTEIKRRGWSYDPTTLGRLNSVLPSPGFAGLSTISNPPTSSEIAQARAFLRRGIPSYGGYLAGSVAVRIFQMAQIAGPAEVNAFAAEIRSTTVSTPNGPVPLANWMMANPEWRQFAGFFENWQTQQPFPRIPGVTI